MDNCQGLSPIVEQTTAEKAKLLKDHRLMSLEDDFDVDLAVLAVVC
ncbi:MAG: hypothetical protein MJA27_11715 [Pseudanabaenales cyanobacterium]|nr:hypothetical protein [Pseudanabaenales cyanobacterium]